MCVCGGGGDKQSHQQTYNGRLGRVPLMYDGLSVTFFGFSSQGIIILVRMMDSDRMSMC